MSHSLIQEDFLTRVRHIQLARLSKEKFKKAHNKHKIIKTLPIIIVILMTSSIFLSIDTFY